MTERSRRRLLRYGSTALLASVAGCASVADRFSKAGQTDGTSTDETQTTTAATTATDTATQSTDAETQQTDTTSETTEEPTDVSEPRVDFEGVPRADDPGEYDYARIGADDAEATATFFGNWKCPYTREFVLGDFQDVLDDFVTSDDLAIEFRAVAYLDGEPFLGDDAPRAARAGLAVWNESPDDYWQYFGTVFSNQPPERQEWATTDRLLRFADAAGVAPVDGVADALASDEYAGDVRATENAAAEAGVWSVPRIVTDEEVTAPTVDFGRTKRQLQRVVED